MKKLLIFFFITMTNPILLFNFSSESNLNNWRVIDDVVMGGQSYGELSINKEGNGVFSGTVSLENNGGFSSARYNFQKIKPKNKTFFKLKLKGDQKKYQFRVKSKRNNYYSYAYTFKTSGEWEEINIPFNKMKPVFRGRNLTMSNFHGEEMEEISILIGNKKPQEFKLEIDKITIE